MKAKLVLSAAVAAVCVAGLGSLASAQALTGVTMVAKASFGSGGTPGLIRPGEPGSGLLFGTGNTERSMAFNPVTGNVVVVSRLGGNFVRSFDGSSGAVVNSLNTSSGLSGGTLLINGVGVTDDGVIYVSNLQGNTNSTTNFFKIYRWSSETSTAAPTTHYSGNGGFDGMRLGDALDVKGPDASGRIVTGQAFVSGAAPFRSFSIANTGASGTTMSAVASTGGTNEGFRLGIALIDNNTVIGRTNTTVGPNFAAGLNLAPIVAGPSTTISTLDFFASGGSLVGLDHQVVNGNALISAVDANSSTVRLFNANDINNIQPLTQLSLVATNTGNGNATGATAWGNRTANPRVVSLYALNTNNGISAFDVTVPFRAGWNVDADGAYITDANWVVGAPTVARDTAIFGSIITAPRTVTLGTNASVGNITFSSTNAYTVSGAGLLTINNGGLVSNTSAVNVTAGNHTISAPISVANSTTVTVSGGTSLTVARWSAPLATRTTTVTGGGTFKINVIYNAGPLIITGSSGAYTSFVDLASGASLISKSDDAAIITDYVKSWYNNGARDGKGLGSSTAGTGTGRDLYATLGVLANTDQFGLQRYASFAGVTVAASDVLVKYTYVGDTNLDGRLDGLDFNAVLSGWANGLTGWANGDSDYSGGVVDDADWARFLAAYSWVTANAGAPFGEPGEPAGAIPEPAALGLLAPAALLLGRRRR